MASAATARGLASSSAPDMEADEEYSSDRLFSDSESEQETKKHENLKIFKVNEDCLEDEERKTCANMTLHCFAARRNQWSTNKELAPICDRLRGSTRKGVDNVHDHKRQWKNIAKKFRYGHDHQKEEGDGCELTEPHRICERKITDVDEDGKEFVAREESRIHPTFAKTIFSPGDITLLEMPPLPIRPVKRRAISDKPAEDSLQYKLNEKLKQRRRMLTKYRHKIAELEKIREEICNDEEYERYREEYLAEEESYRIAKKGKGSSDLVVPSKKRKMAEPVKEPVKDESEEDVFQTEEDE